MSAATGTERSIQIGERTIQVDDFGHYVYLRFGPARAEFSLTEGFLILQRVKHHWTPPGHSPTQFLEWQNRRRRPCESKEKAIELFVEWLDFEGLTAQGTFIP